MSPSVYVCCGGSVVEGGMAYPRDPNLFAACSRLADGMGDNETAAGRAEGEDQAPASEQETPLKESPVESR